MVELGGRDSAWARGEVEVLRPVPPPEGRLAG